MFSGSVEARWSRVAAEQPFDNALVAELLILAWPLHAVVHIWQRSPRQNKNRIVVTQVVKRFGKPRGKRGSLLDASVVKRIGGEIKAAVIRDKGRYCELLCRSLTPQFLENRSELVDG
jgi:hypothetical protein